MPLIPVTPVPDYDLKARGTERVIGYRLVRAAINKDTMLYGFVEFAQWSAASDDHLDRQYWYEVRFQPLGQRWRDTWTVVQPVSDSQANRLHFSVLERTAEHPQGATSVAKLGPIGHIRMLPHSVGLGTFLRNQLIGWVSSLHPDASVAQGKLSSVDAKGENKHRRSRFYEGANFQMSLQDDGSGAFWADRLADLEHGTDSGKVVELSSADLLGLLRCAPDLARVEQQAKQYSAECGRLRIAAATAHSAAFRAKVVVAALCVGIFYATANGWLAWRVW